MPDDRAIALARGISNPRNLNDYRTTAVFYYRAHATVILSRRKQALMGEDFDAVVEAEHTDRDNGWADKNDMRTARH